MKTVLVTGANGGIGRALCTSLREQGYRVIATDREAMTATPDYVCFDLAWLADDDGIARFTAMLEQCLAGDALVGLVNNAAVQMLGGVDQLSMADFMHTMTVNVAAPLALAQICFPHLKAAKGAIVNIGSIHARLTKPGFVSYATSKAALEGLTRALAVDCGEFVRVNAVSPAAVDTDMLRAGFAAAPEKFKQLKAFHPVNGIATATEVAAAVGVLMGGTLPFANGAIWNLDGGIGARLHDPE